VWGTPSYGQNSFGVLDRELRWTGVSGSGDEGGVFFDKVIITKKRRHVGKKPGRSSSKAAPPQPARFPPAAHPPRSFMDSCSNCPAEVSAVRAIRSRRQRRTKSKQFFERGSMARSTPPGRELLPK